MMRTALDISAGRNVGPANKVTPPRRITMGKGKANGGRKLAVRVTYEGSRLSAECLTKAYERLVPVARAQTKATEDLTEGATRVQPARRR